MEQAALLGAVQVLAAAASPDTLRRILHQLVDDLAPDTPAPDTKTPANGGNHAAGEVVWQNKLAPQAVTPHAPRTTREASPAKTTRPDSSAANGSASRLTAAEWLKFRERVRAEMKRRQLDLAGLAEAICMSFSTVKNNMLKRSPPSAPLTLRLRNFVAGSNEVAQRSGSGGNGVAAVQREAAELFAPKEPATSGNGHAAQALAPETLKAIRRRRHAIPLTNGSLAEQLGVEVAELDAAIAGKAISAAAASRLAEWATAAG